MSERQERRDDATDPESEGGPVKLDRQSAQTGQIIRALREELGDFKRELGIIRAHARNDHRWVLSAIAGVFVLLLTGFFIGYIRVDDKIDRQGEKVDIRIDRVVEQLGTLNGTLTRVDQKLDDLTHPQSPLPRRQ